MTDPTYDGVVADGEPWVWEDVPLPVARLRADGSLQALNAAARQALPDEEVDQDAWRDLLAGSSWRVVVRVPEQAGGRDEIAGSLEQLAEPDLLSEAIRQAPVPLTVQDALGRVLAANDAAARGGPEGAAPTVDPTDAGRLAAVEQRVRFSRESEVVEIKQLSDEGPRTVMSVQFPVTAGRSLLVAGLGVDITSRITAEAAVTRSRDLARDASRLRDEFMSRMSHELRTPLTAILGFGELLLLSNDMDEQDRASADQVVHAGRNMLQLVDRLLDLARLSGGDLPVAVEPTVVGDVVEAVLVAVTPLALALAVELKRGDVRGLVVRADPQRLQQVLVNLIDNAVRYGADGGSVALTFERGDDDVAVHVDDDGPGLSDEARASLFTAFERHHPEAGSGLGLALAHGFVTAMGGSLTHTDRPEGGTRFSVRLPFDDPQQVPAPSSPASSRRPHNALTVVYIEDNAGNVRLMERVLGRWPGLTLVPAVQGSIGVELVRRHQPAVVLLDLNLPDMHGAQVLQQLRADPTTCDLPVVVISADATLAQRRHLLDLGAFAYLTKPFVISDLVSVLEEAFALPAR